ncbi:sterol carrier protein [Halapricum sp. CBA1109]|uniref:SCP2 sterol-binding domain-containing protein n=1 Tax=Halapricum sp. CBA1109 TaxID=2668068 RepID=UPI0012F9CF84|nr:SCP2 sterol-binding domain-containing protein [Halapricum sp. CBA1109]MUV90752.1 sterol carrier protein [Halapricum sp. CBA1109]
MAITLPAEAGDWIDELGRRLNDSEAFAAAAEGWGVEFDGDFVFEIQPDDSYDGEPITLYLALRDGECLDTDRLADPTDVAHGFALRGGYTEWKRLIRGETDVVEAVMTGTLDVEGSRMQAMRYQDALLELGATATDIDTDFEH